MNLMTVVYTLCGIHGLLILVVAFTPRGRQ